jgi:phosphoribosylamine--glycine ligase
LRYLGIGDTCDLGAMYYRLAQAGHEVKVYIAHPDANDIYGGMIDTIDDWRSALPWIKAAGADGVIIFESAGMGQVQDTLRAEGYFVIGGSAYGDRLESERQFGQDIFMQIGLSTAASHHFTRYDDAIAFLNQHPARYVFKLNGHDALRTRNYLGVMEDGADIKALLSTYQKQSDAPIDFVLMEHIQGVEVGVGSYFNGRAFLRPACLDWEHKRFFAGNQGELTGEMGTIVTFEHSTPLFERTLARLEPLLQANGYCGYININLIVNEAGLWPLEFTSRFGYPGFAICSELQQDDWPQLFQQMLHSDDTVLKIQPGFAAGVVLTVPPFPYSQGYAEISKGLPIILQAMTATEQSRLHLAEVAMVDGQLVTSGMLGYVSVANGTGPTVEAACQQAYALAQKVVVPNIRYRDDIGQRVMAHDYAALQQLGYID